MIKLSENGKKEGGFKRARAKLKIKKNLMGEIVIKQNFRILVAVVGIGRSERFMVGKRKYDGSGVQKNRILAGNWR